MYILGTGLFLDKLYAELDYMLNLDRDVNGLFTDVTYLISDISD